ncbi:MAG: aminotransferase class V-fold PLP-dependent enzyme, partial [Planctomycetota bacterium]|nr:aminotransferase class V-fold PLP-dependent enzyme [Planctomycetota bacterium]
MRHEHWTLHPEVTFLNHGSFGATPRVVLEEQRRLQDALEREPLRFLAPERELEPKLDAARERLAALVGARSQDVAVVRNAT